MPPKRTQNHLKIDLKILNGAILDHYQRDETDLSVIPQGELIGLLGDIQSTQHLESSVNSYISDVLPGRQLSELHHGVLTLITESCNEVLDAILLPEDMLWLLKSAVASMSRIAVADGIVALTRQHPVIAIIDNLTRFCIGIGDLDDRTVVIIEEKIKLSLDSLELLMDPVASAKAETRMHMMSLLAKEIEGESQDELLRVDRVEQRLIENEESLLRAGRSRNIAGKMLNDHLGDCNLPDAANEFIRGAWFDSLQLIIAKKGPDSEDWGKAIELTEKLAWSVNSDNFASDAVFATDTEYLAVEDDDADGQQETYFDVIESLPHELEQLLVSLAFDQDAIRDQLGAIVGLHLTIMQGGSVAATAWQKMDIDEVFGNVTAVSHDLIKQVERLESGQWFVLTAEGEPPKHIKLILKLSDLQQLLFSDRNGQKVMQTTFDEFAYLLTSESVRVLPGRDAIGRNLRRRLNKLVALQLKKDQEAKARAREAEEAKRLEQFEPTRLLEAVQRAHTDDPITITEELTQQVEELNQGAWLKLIHPDYAAMEGKVAVKFPSRDKVILVDRTGLNLGEYTHELLCQLISLGGCELLGEKSADELAMIVNKVRGAGIEEKPTGVAE
jgi:hypothetical protein